MNICSIITKHTQKLMKNSKDNKLSWEYPFNVDDMTNAFISNPYHNQCICIKTMNILGNGFEDSVMKKLDEVTPTDSAINILYKTIQDLEIYGNAFWEIVQTQNLASLQIFHIPAQTMKLTKTGYQQTVGTSTVDFDSDQIFHFKYFTPLSTIYGAPDYLPALKPMSLYDKIITYNEKFFANNAIPDMAIVVTGGDMSETAKYTIQRFFRDKFQGYENAHKVLFLPVNEGMTVKFEKLQSDSQDASFMKLLTQTITDIIACHGVPPRMISIVNQSQLGGGGETAGQMDIFNKAVIAPKQNIISGLFDELNKKYKIFSTDAINRRRDRACPVSTYFSFIPVEYNIPQDSISDLMRRV